ncbi:MAG: tetratricopeptide repeat protein, partial [Spirochaetes bacterium]|nr:tetratricopeptide repeat protein [Spirochaetota bacterium]
YQKALDTPNYDNLGNTLSNMGIAYGKKGDYDAAIKFFQKALDAPGYDSPGNALNNMGIAYYEKGDYDTAIELYQKALDTPDYDGLGNALNNMGNAYSEKGDYDTAIEFFQKALDTPDYDGLGNALNNMGIVYSDKGDYDTAIEFYQKALDTPGFDAPGKALNNMGIAYRNLKKYKESLKCHEMALKSKDIVENDNALKYTKSLIKSTKKSIKTQQRIRDLEKAGQSEEFYEIKKDEREKDVLLKIFESFGDVDERDKFFKEIEANQKTLDEFIQISESESKKNNILYILRRFNSYTPIINSYSDVSKGGGYFITCDNQGIVIDPGFNFIENFFNNKLRVADIDKIIITHAHNDHTVDLESIITLIYLLNKKLKKEVSPEEFELKRKRVDLYFNAGTFKKYAGWLSLKREEINNFYILNPSDEIKITPHLLLKITKAKHHEIISKEYCVGLIFSYKDNDIIFTSDTEWDESIGDQYKNLKNPLLIPHIGTINRKEADYLNGKDLDQCIYPCHLGLIGVTKMIDAVNPELTVISEFGEEIKDKIKICRKIEEVFKMKIIPADIGLKIRLDDYRIYCFYCDEYVNYNKIKSRKQEVSNNYIIFYNCEDHDDDKSRARFKKISKI